MLKRTNIVFFLLCLFSAIFEQPLYCSLLSEKFNYAIQPPNFSNPEKIEMSSEEIVEQVRPILRQRLELMNYDRTYPVLQFLDHYENCKKENRDIAPIDAYRTFRFRPLSNRDRGGPCVSLTLDLHAALPEHLKAYMILAKLPAKYQQLGFPEYSHTAVLIKYINPSDVNDKGYILLDPSFDIDEPVVLKEDKSIFYYDTKLNGIWKFYLAEDQILCQVGGKQNESANALYADDQFKMVYKTQCVLNPIECSAMPMILADRRLSLLSRDLSGMRLAHLKIELNKKRVVWDQSGVRFEPIQFQQMQAGWTFPKQFSEALHTPDDELSEKVLKIINNMDVIDSLYIDYMKLIRETGDFSITGIIDLNQLDLVINNFQTLENIK